MGRRRLGRRRRHRALDAPRAAQSALTDAIDTCTEAAAAYGNDACTALAARADLQIELGQIRGAAARAAAAADAPHGDHAEAAMALLDAAAATYEQIGHPRRVAAALHARASLLAALPPSALPADHPHALEAEEVQLDQAGQQLGNALKLCERALAGAAPRDLPLEISLPLAREAGAIKAAMASVGLRSAALQRKVAAAAPPQGLTYPVVDGRDDSAVAAFLFVEKGTPTEMSAEERALIHATAAVAYAGPTPARATAYLREGEVLIALARAKGYGAAAWAPPEAEVLSVATPQQTPRDAPAADAPAAEEAGEEAAGEGGRRRRRRRCRRGGAGAEDAALGKERLREALALALEEDQTEVAARAALALADAAGSEDADERARLLATGVRACAAREHWLAVWQTACGPRDRNALLVRLLDEGRRRWVQPAALPAAAAAAAVLGADDGGCAVWRSLAVSADPLAEVVPLLPDGGRVVQISISPDGTTLYAAAVGAAAAAAGADGAGGEGGGDGASPVSRVSRLAVPAGSVRALGAAAEAMVATQAKAALARAKDQLVGAAPTGRRARAGLPEEEAALRAVVSDAEALLAPLLMPLMPRSRRRRRSARRRSPFGSCCRRRWRRCRWNSSQRCGCRT